MVGCPLVVIVPVKSMVLLIGQATVKAHQFHFHPKEPDKNLHAGHAAFFVKVLSADTLVFVAAVFIDTFDFQKNPFSGIMPAHQLKDFTAAQESTLAETLANADKPTVYLAGNSSMLSTAGDAMYQSDMIRLAGGTNVAAEITDSYWVEISYEQLLAWDPAYIILASDASYTAQDVLTDPNLAACQAVVNGNVYQLPNKAEAWDSPVPSGILGSVWLAGVLHPDLFSIEACEALIDEYYETFYGFTYSEN